MSSNVSSVSTIATLSLKSFTNIWKCLLTNQKPYQEISSPHSLAPKTPKSTLLTPKNINNTLRSDSEEGIRTTDSKSILKMIEKYFPLRYSGTIVPSKEDSITTLSTTSWQMIQLKLKNSVSKIQEETPSHSSSPDKNYPKKPSIQCTLECLSKKKNSTVLKILQLESQSMSLGGNVRSMMLTTSQKPTTGISWVLSWTSPSRNN